MKLLIQRGISTYITNILLFLYILSIYIWSDREDMSIYSNILCLLLISFIFLHLKIKDITFPKDLLALIGFDFVCLSSVLWAENQDYSVDIAFKTLPMLMLFCVAIYNYIKITKQIDYFIYTIYMCGIILAIYTMISQSGGILGYFSLLSSGIRAGGNVNNVNVLAIAFSISYIIALFSIVVERKPSYILSLPILITATLGTGSNKGLIVLIIGTLIIFYSKIDKNKIYHSILYPIIIIMFIGFLILILQNIEVFTSINSRFSGLINTIFGKDESNHSALLRMYMLNAGIEQFLKTPLLGIGINNGRLVSFYATGELGYLHNNYIEILVDCGIIGFFTYYYPFYRLTKCFYKGFLQKDKLSIMMFAIFISWLFIQVGYVCYYAKPTYIYLALGAICSYMASCNKQNEKRTIHIK